MLQRCFVVSVRDTPRTTRTDPLFPYPTLFRSLSNEVLPGNTAVSTTLRGFLDRIAHRYGKARRVWVMNRGVPTEESLQHMRAGDPPVHYLVGTPKGRLSKLEKDHRKAGLKSVQPVDR